ncbi:MAG TPA: PilZ domain-containing protein [Pyrinomonadaceae bacterium]|jgi:hypothetical protein
MASAWETINSDRRCEPRHKVSLRASVSVVDAGADEKLRVSVLAHTRDMSKEGLCLVMPDGRLGEEAHTVLIVLVLPSGVSVKLEGRSAYCTPLKPDEPTAGCLAGVLITRLEPEDRAAYDDFIDSL